MKLEITFGWRTDGALAEFFSTVNQKLDIIMATNQAILEEVNAARAELQTVKAESQAASDKIATLSQSLSDKIDELEQQIAAGAELSGAVAGLRADVTEINNIFPNAEPDPADPA